MLTIVSYSIPTYMVENPIFVAAWQSHTLCFGEGVFLSD